MNSFWTLYGLALIPLIIGGIMYYRSSKRFVWQEWVFNTLLCFAIAGCFHAVAIKSATTDIETWSGQINTVVHKGAWVEYYEEAVYKTVYYTTTESYTVNGKRHTRTVRKSKRVFSHWRPCQRKHNDQYYAHTTLPGLEEVWIDRSTYFDYGQKLGGQEIHYAGRRVTGEHNSRMISGDPNDHKFNNTVKAVIPVTNEYAWENKLKAVKSLHNFPAVPEKVVLPDYPSNPDHFRSNRLIGSAGVIDGYAFDQMNSRLGPIKYVNVIFVGLGNVDSIYGKWLEAKWRGGKQNDVVVVWGGDNRKPTWVQAFGWTDQKIVLRNLETVVLANGAINDVLPEVEKIIREDYVIKDWHHFDYLSVPIPTGWIIGYILFQLVSQCALFYYYHHNDIGENGGSANGSSRFMYNCSRFMYKKKGQTYYR